VTTTPIADYALLSDCNSIVLSSRAGSIDWMCCPRFDAPSFFGALLGDEAGRWSIRPEEPKTHERRYVGRTLVLETTWTTATGTVVAREAMATGPNPGGHDLGRDAPHLLVRHYTCTAGRVALDVEFSPRPNYGLAIPRLALVDGGAIARDESGMLALSGPEGLRLDDDHVVRSHVELAAGEDAAFALAVAPDQAGARIWSAAEIREQLALTEAAWGQWSDHHANYDGPWRELVDMSARVLQGLSFQPTGAIVAAATTSLPEEIGGERNWDYRFSWVRDASFTLDALWVAACPDEAQTFFDFIVGAAEAGVHAGQPLQIMFGIGGEQELDERILDHLPGWRNSAPVRIGNAAWNQTQLDVYGELLSAAHRLRHQLTHDEQAQRFFIQLAEAARERWTETDQGIWEVRSLPRHFVYSKLMCWLALDRALALVEVLDAGAFVDGWRQTRGEIADAIVTRGWSERAGAFAQSFDSDTLDASALMIPVVGFLPADDPRVMSTIDAIASQLTDDRGLVFRYLDSDDGVSGGEGADRQPQPGSPEAPGGGVVRLHERIEHRCQAIGGDADAGVGHLDLQRGVIGAGLEQRHLDRHLAPNGELHGVADQVGDHLLQPLGIADQPGGHLGVDVQDQLQALAVRLAAQGPQPGADAVAGAERDPVQPQLAGVDLREVEHVVDQPQQAAGRGARALQVLALLGRQHGLQRQLGHPDDAVHGRADLVAHPGQEVRSSAHRLLGGVPGLDHRLLGPLQLQHLAAQGPVHLGQGPGAFGHPQLQVGVGLAQVGLGLAPALLVPVHRQGAAADQPGERQGVARGEQRGSDLGAVQPRPLPPQAQGAQHHRHQDRCRQQPPGHAAGG
jgi:GH15 family glucan-1,4-alpha-glucosidase